MAAMLERMDMDYVVYEQAEQFGRVGAGIHLSPNVSKVFRPLGIEPELKRLAHRPSSWINRMADTGEVTFDHPLGDAMEARFGAATLLMHRADLHRTLSALVAPARVQLGRRLAGLAPNGAGVKLEFADGSLKEIGSSDVPRAFAVYEATRKDRCTRVQEASHANEFMRKPTDTDWLYRYDAWSEALALDT